MIYKLDINKKLNKIIKCKICKNIEKNNCIIMNIYWLLLIYNCNLLRNKKINCERRNNKII